MNFENVKKEFLTLKWKQCLIATIIGTVISFLLEFVGFHFKLWTYDGIWQLLYLIVFPIYFWAALAYQYVLQLPKSVLKYLHILFVVFAFGSIMAAGMLIKCFSYETTHWLHGWNEICCWMLMFGEAAKQLGLVVLMNKVMKK
jgi:hypothetical protein